jgi:alpha-tubulin suppressor-like RCC1 family protein
MGSNRQLLDSLRVMPICSNSGFFHEDGTRLAARGEEENRMGCPAPERPTGKSEGPGRRWSRICSAVWTLLVAGMAVTSIPACGVGGSGTLTPTIAPASPAGLTASSGNGRISLSWMAVSAASSYSLKRSSVSGGPYAPVAGSSSLSAASFVDLGLAQGTAYYYVVSAMNPYGESADSAEVRGVPGLTATLISAGFGSSLALLEDGTLWAWGDNTYGQLGNGSGAVRSNLVHIASGPTSVTSGPNVSNVAVLVLDLSHLTAISAGGNFCLALKSDGTVWAWGLDNDGQLGSGDGSENFFSPVQVPGLAGVTAVSAGGDFGVALKSDGTVWLWGFCNGVESFAPVQVPGLAGVTAISAGGDPTGGQFGLALKSDGTVWAWGANDQGQLGNALTTDSATPFQVPDLTGIKAISAGGNHSLALQSDGTVWSWGSNSDGQLGNGTSIDSSRVVQVSNLTGITAIAAGDVHSLALRSDGTIMAWGRNSVGQLGNGSTTGSTIPIRISSPVGVAAIAAGGAHSLALKSEGSIWAWGGDSTGQLGNGTGPIQPLPVQTQNLTGVASVAAGGNHSLAIRPDGSVWAWGSNGDGQLGDGTNTDASYRLQLSVPTSVGAIAAGGDHSLAVRSDGTVWAWGYNFFGQLGNGANADSNVPVQAGTPTGITAVSAGGSGGEQRGHSLALRSDGTVWAWGCNGNGQLGNGSTADSNLPLQVPGLTGMTAIAAGGAHSLALKSDGTVWAWGYNFYTQLGTSLNSDSAVPLQVSCPPGVTAIAAGRTYSVALLSDGTVWGMGFNQFGTLTRPLSGIFLLPPPGLILTPTGDTFTGVTAISAGGHGSLALRTDGTVWAWPTSGMPGAADQVSGLAGVTAISAGENSYLALLSNFTVMGWGDNSSGQLGIPFSFFSAIPRLVGH